MFIPCHLQLRISCNENNKFLCACGFGSQSDFSCSFFFSFCTPGKFVTVFLLFCWLKHLWCGKTAENIYCKFKFLCNRLRLDVETELPNQLPLCSMHIFYTFRSQYLNITSFMSFTRTKSHTEENRIDYKKSNYYRERRKTKSWTRINKLIKVHRIKKKNLD